MKIKQKIEKQIKDKELQLNTLRKAQKLADEKDIKNLEEDTKIRNLINPFYTKKWKPSSNTYSMIFFVTLQAKIESEIKDLKKLLK